MNRICSACNTEIEITIYRKDRTICSTCFNKNKSKRKNKKNALPPNTISVSYQQPKIKNFLNNNKNRTLIIGFSKCGETHLMKYILLQKHEPFLVISESPNEYPNNKAQTSDETQPLNEYENSTVVFVDFFVIKTKSNFDLFFTRVRHNNIDIYYISQSCFHLPKNAVCNNSNINIFVNHSWIRYEIRRVETAWS